MGEPKENTASYVLINELNQLSGNFLKEASDLRKLRGKSVDSVNDGVLLKIERLADHVYRETSQMRNELDSTYTRDEDTTLDEQVHKTLELFARIEQTDPTTIVRMMNEMYGKVKFDVRNLTYRYDDAVYGRKNENALSNTTDTLRANDQWSVVDQALLQKNFSTTREVRSFLDVRELARRTPEEKALLADYLRRSDLSLLDYVLEPFREIRYPIDTLRFMVTRRYVYERFERLLGEMDKEIRQTANDTQYVPDSANDTTAALQAKLDEKRERYERQREEVARLATIEKQLLETRDEKKSELVELRRSIEEQRRNAQYLGDLARIIRMYRGLEKNFLENITSANEDVLKEGNPVPDFERLTQATNNDLQSTKELVDYTLEFEYYRNMIVRWYRELTGLGKK